MRPLLLIVLVCGCRGDTAGSTAPGRTGQPWSQHDDVGTSSAVRASLPSGYWAAGDAETNPGLKDRR